MVIDEAVQKYEQIKNTDVIIQLNDAIVVVGVIGFYST